MLKKLSLTLVGISAIALSSIGSAEAVTINFDPLTTPGTDFSYYLNDPFYSEKGFTISQGGSIAQLYPINSGDYSKYNPPYDPYNGSTSFASDVVNGNTDIVLTKNGGGSFNLKSIDLDWLNGPGSGNVPVNFTGTYANGGTIQANFLLDTSKGFETFDFTGFEKLSSVSWKQEKSPSTLLGYHHFDNIVLEPVPEPVTILGTLVAGALGIGIKRKQKVTN